MPFYFFQIKSLYPNISGTGQNNTTNQLPCTLHMSLRGTPHVQNRNRYTEDSDPFIYLGMVSNFDYCRCFFFLGTLLTILVAQGHSFYTRGKAGILKWLP